MKRFMMMLTVGLAVLCCGGSADAQGRWFGSATWQMGFPTGDTKNFVNDTSFRGFGLDFRKVVRPGTTAGVLLGWNVFHERVDGTYVMKNGAVTGLQDRYLNVFPIMVGMHKYFGVPGGPRPYVGASAGAMVVIRTFALGVIALENDDWDWGAVPEVGIVWPTQAGAALVINGRYNWSFTHQNLLGQNEDLTYWGINIGFVWEQY